ncbi:hypothetical protein ZWY2020_015995 [Hordeum vulgare]|nr:hypothetical protein ZWY2020_015995 [Hordeum vulgare]
MAHHRSRLGESISRVERMGTSGCATTRRVEGGVGRLIGEEIRSGATAERKGDLASWVELGIEEVLQKLRPRCDVCYSRPTIGMKSAFRAESGAGPSEINPNSKIVEQAFVKGHNLSDGNTGSCANVFHPNSHVQLQHSSDAADSRRSISPRSMSREIAASSCIILQDMYVENSQGELKHACGIKREYPEPKLLDIRLSTHDKPQRQSIKTLINSPFGNTAAVHSCPEDVMNVLVNWVKNYQTEDVSRFMQLLVEIVGTRNYFDNSSLVRTSSTTSPSVKMVESGIYTVEFMKNWNRTKVAKELNPASMDKVRTNILMDILTIRDNVAALPDFVKQLMRQYEDAVISNT